MLGFSWLGDYNAINVLISALVGMGIGVVIAACFKRPLGKTGRNWLLGLTILAPVIGNSARLIQVNDTIVHLNIFLFMLCITILVRRLLFARIQHSDTKTA